ncbi:MAG: GspH/FimT family pseudopilin, partial [Caldimonas sp.]
MTTKQRRGSPSPIRHAGITLLEACVVVAVTAIVAASAAPSLRDLVDARRLESAATRLAADVQLARAEALARNRSLRLSFHAGSDASCWILHTGAAADCGCAHGESVVCTAPAVEIKSVALANAERVGLFANVASI